MFSMLNTGTPPIDLQSPSEWLSRYSSIAGTLENVSLHKTPRYTPREVFAELAFVEVPTK